MKSKGKINFWNMAVVVLRFMSLKIEETRRYITGSSQHNQFNEKKHTDQIWKIKILYSYQICKISELWSLFEIKYINFLWPLKHPFCKSWMKIKKKKIQILKSSFGSFQVKNNKTYAKIPCIFLSRSVHKEFIIKKNIINFQWRINCLRKRNRNTHFHNLRTLEWKQVAL